MGELIHMSQKNSCLIKECRLLRTHIVKTEDVRIETNELIKINRKKIIQLENNIKQRDSYITSIQHHKTRIKEELKKAMDKTTVAETKHTDLSNKVLQLQSELMTRKKEGDYLFEKYSKLQIELQLATQRVSSVKLSLHEAEI